MLYYETSDGTRRPAKADDVTNVRSLTPEEARRLTPAAIAEAVTFEAAVCRACHALSIAHAPDCPDAADADDATDRPAA